MPYNTKNLKRDASNIPIPQYFDADADDFQPLDNGMNIKEAQVMVPTEIQSRYGTTIQTHNAVTIAANATNDSGWIDVRGYDKVGINVLMTAGTGMALKISTSFDGSSYFSEKTIYQGTSIVYSDVNEIPAPYIRISVKNTDASTPKTTNAQIYLKV